MVSFLNFNFIVLSLAWLVVVFFPSTSWGYIGPGAGFAVVTSFIMVMTAFFLAMASTLFWPIRCLIRKFKHRNLKKLSQYSLRKKKVIILGFDGMEISLLNRFINEGCLPNMSKLARSGTLTSLGTTYPPESPVAWSSFLCGCNPGRHNIFDFLTRDPENYLPNFSMAEVQQPKLNLPFGKFKIPIIPGPVKGHRKTKPFWTILGERGISCTALRVPSTFPVDKFPGLSLSSMGTPDLLGTQGSSSFYSSNDKKKNSERVIHVKIEGHRVRNFLKGPLNNFLKKPEQSRIPFSVRWDSSRQKAFLKIPDLEEIKLELREFSEWIEVVFPMSFGTKVPGICKFYLKQIEPDFELYVSPINMDPENPAFPISNPPQYSQYLAKAVGKFSTLGLAEDTWMLNSENLDESAFIKHCLDILDERKKVFFHEFDRFNRGCLISVFDTIDRIQHMFWRLIDSGHPKFDQKLASEYGNVICEMYKLMDQLTGHVMKKVDQHTSFYILSDHGFRSFRYSMNVNTWLKNQGYLVMKRGQGSSEKFFKGVDWSLTRAYAIGLGGIYLNLKGREKYGIVDSDEVAENLREEIIAKLLQFEDPHTGQKPLFNVPNFKAIYKGDHIQNAPDILLGFKPNYRVSWKTALGGIPNAVMENNVANWSGDHCMDPSFVPGVFLANRKYSNSTPNIMDIAPTILNEFGLEIPKDMDGSILK